MHEPHILGRKSGRYKWRCCLSFPWDKITYTIASFKHLGKMSAIFQDSGSSVTLLGETSSGSPYRVVSQPRADTPVAQVAAHCPAVPAPPSRPCSLEEVEPASPPPSRSIIPEAHGTLRFPRSRAAVRCLRTSVSWGLGPRGLAPCRRGCSFRYCSSFDSPRRSSAMSSAKDTVRSQIGTRNGQYGGRPPQGPQDHLPGNAVR